MQSSSHFVQQKFQLKSLFSEDIEEAKQQLEICQQCNFTLLNKICYSCNKKQVKVEKVEVKSQRYSRKLEKKDEKSLYIFCLDNSGSVQVDYNIQDNGKEIPKYDISNLKNFIKDEADFTKLKVLGERVLYQNMTNIKDFISMGASVYDIVNSLQTQKNKPAKKIETRKSRKSIMKQIMVSILNELKTRDNCDVIVTFFNQQIVAQGIGRVELKFSENEQNAAYSIGKQNAKRIKKYCSKQFNECSKLFENQQYQSNGGTALGPAIVFCCGIVSQLKYTHNQIILITDGASNTGFGDLQSVKNLENNPHAYKVSEEYANIATNFFIPNNISMNLLCFSDCEIKYYILDKFFDMTGSIPISLDVVEKKVNGINDKYVTSKIYQKVKDKFKFQVIDQPSQCFEHLKIAFVCSDSSIKLENKDYGKKGYGSIFFSCGKLNISKAKISLILQSSTQISSLPSFTITIIVQSQIKQNQHRVIHTKQFNLFPKKPIINQQTKKQVSNKQNGEMFSLSYQHDNHSISHKRGYDFDDDYQDNY